MAFKRPFQRDGRFEPNGLVVVGRTHWQVQTERTKRDFYVHLIAKDNKYNVSYTINHLSVNIDKRKTTN
jgi:hypothetical protein